MRAAARHLVLGFVVAGMVVMTAGLAWACTPVAEVKVTPSAGAPGSKATVDVRSFNTRGTAVSVYWNAVSDNTKLGEASAPNGSLAVTIPADAQGGLTTLWAVQVDSQGTQWKKSVAFDVIAPSGSQPAGDTNTEPPPAPTSPAPAPRANDPAKPTASAPAAQAPAAAPSGNGKQKNPAATGGKRAQQPARASAPAPTSPAKANPAAPTPNAPEPASPEPAPLEAAAASASTRSAAQDLWSGFRENRRPGTLTPSLSSETPAGSGGSIGAALGVALLTIGVLLVPAAWLAGTALRRRKVTVWSSSGRP